MANPDQVLFTTKRNDEVGRFAVAKQPLKPGDLIFSETPFAYGPKSDSPPLCLGCFAPADCTVLCTKCSWPVCGPQCEAAAPHKEYECEAFARAKVKFQPMEDPTQICLQYECVTPLRVLLAMEKDPKRWEEEVRIMEAHNDVRRTKPVWQFNQVNVVDYLRGPCRCDRFPEDLIHTVCGILEINAFEARANSGYLVRCLYPKLAILSHNCISNIHHSVAPDDFKVAVRATVETPEGGELFSSYTYSLWPTLVRREFLKESKYFECTCKRCCDKTELGTHMGTLKCQKCDNGVILSTDPLSDSCEWKCTHCEFKTKAGAVRRVFEAIQTEIDAVEMVSGAQGIEQRESIYRKYRSVLHPKNAYMTILRTALTQLYGRAEGYSVEDLPDLLLERKVELCYQLLEVLDVVEPGASRIRGITLYELHAPLMILARNEYNSDMITREEFRKKMQEAVDILGKSVEILKNEVPNSNEGRLGLVAQQAHEGLIKNFELLIETA
ncbi:histone-lysine N-methyltransferase ASHR1 [Asbolus verrucosus]|uniref:Histone-lysine N-methyltransferase ASHR1 n=1 Tax=Asbolus verrucosus TaxID=1661398 RepID=A0A482VSB0_ASBVE|nr:histone-lysine N-methyltransferase ASHR1 [Asbolus verrucosus]